MEIVKAFNMNNLNIEIVIKGTHENPLFRASDVGEVLEITNIRQSISLFNENEKRAVITTDSTGRNQSITFLTAKGLYRMLFKSRKPIAELFQNWVYDVIEEIRLKGSYEKDRKIAETEKLLEVKNMIIQEKEEKLEETQKLLEETEKMKNFENTPQIYIYNIDTTKKDPELKIGYSLNVNQRIKPYKQVCKHGKIEFCVPLFYQNVKTIENYIHAVFNDFRVADEVFSISVDEAKIVIMNIIDMFNIMRISIPTERREKLKEITSLKDIENKPKMFTSEIACQTDLIEDDNTEINETDTQEKTNEITEKIKRFINDCCIIRPDVEVGAKDIQGQFRLWCREAKKELSRPFVDYLDTHFKYTRLSVQDKNNVINGYKGITLKEIDYKKNIIVSDVQTFLFQVCEFTPRGTILNSTLFREYELWKKSIGKSFSEESDKTEMHKYLKESPHVLYETIWAKDGGGQGYYGLCLKSELHHHKNTSTTGKKVEKRQKDTNHLLATWETIAKAANYENINSAKMSHSIKNKTIFKDDYYYCLG